MGGDPGGRGDVAEGVTGRASSCEFWARNVQYGVYS